jgi:hypothetical protein
MSNEADDTDAVIRIRNLLYVIRVTEKTRRRDAVGRVPGGL